jgi:hypothetical protein
MRGVGYYRGARTISLALAAGLIAFEAILVFATGGVGIPGVFHVRVFEPSETPKTAKAFDPDGGESVIAKLPTDPTVTGSGAKSEDASPKVAGEPRLDGLADIPLGDWIRQKATSETDDQSASDDAAPAPKTREDLPWDAVEPVPFGPVTAAVAPPEANAPAKPAAVAAIQLPASGEMESWVKAKATEIKGGDRARALYHFEFWLEPPEEMKRRLAAVAYEFNTPAVMPQSQMSRDQETGFRISAGGLTCADKVTVTLKFSDGRSQQVAVDGCKLVDTDPA